MLLLFSKNVLAWTAFAPKDYDECILENMKGVTSDVGARLVNNSCHEKFKNIADKSQKHKWTLISSGNGGSVYADKSSITKQGNIVTVDMILDDNKMGTLNNKSFYSRPGKMEIDCNNLTQRTLSYEYKSGHMGEGDTIYSSQGLGAEEKIMDEFNKL